MVGKTSASSASPLLIDDDHERPRKDRELIIFDSVEANDRNDLVSMLKCFSTCIWQAVAVAASFCKIFRRHDWPLQAQQQTFSESPLVTVSPTTDFQDFALLLCLAAQHASRRSLHYSEDEHLCNNLQTQLTTLGLHTFIGQSILHLCTLKLLHACAATSQPRRKRQVCGSF